MVDYARIAKNIADAKKGYRAAKAAGWDLDVIDGYARVHGRAAFVRALKPAPLPDSIFRDDDEGVGRSVASRGLKVQRPEISSTVSHIEFRALWFELKHQVPAPDRAKRIDSAVALKNKHAMASYGRQQATGVH